MKTIRLTDSEINNASDTYYNDKKYTIIRRPQANGKQWIAAIGIDDNKVIVSEYADTKEQVPDAIREVNRWMDKCYGGGKMSHKSRNRKKGN